jgi:iron-sulfur cluster repair protein YtfE (RIC family)
VDALALLKKDHDQVKKMLKDLDDTTDRAIKTRQDLFERLKFSLTVHEQMEEAVLYPALKEHAETKEIVLEAYEEHDVVDTILGELEQTPFDDETWHAKLTVMRENLLHHIQEEEDQMFGYVRRLFDKATLESLGEQMRTIKAQARAA